MQNNPPHTSTVFLVGAGPGAVDLLTLRADKIIRSADAVIYDALVNPQIPDSAPPTAERHYVGKRAGHHSMAQEDINNLIIDVARRCRRTVRLKGGDPFVFGRGGEEVEALIAAGIPYEIIPGITAGVAVPTAAGIPVTHRAMSRSVTFVTGHPRSDAGEDFVSWKALADTGGTIVFYMGLTSLPLICRKLAEAGLSPETPVAVIQDGTLPTQCVRHGVLANIEAAVAEAKLRAPVLIVVGNVAALGEKWAIR